MILDLPQDEQDELYDFYCQFGSFDKNGRVIGLFQHRAAAVDSSDRDIPWEAFQQGLIPDDVREMEDADEARVDQTRARQIDAIFTQFLQPQG